jgi:uncharacterized protein (TIGR03118 family)
MSGQALRPWIAAGTALLATVALLFVTGAASGGGTGTYTVHNLNSDVKGLAPNFDPALQNGWGIAAPPTGPWWVSDNGTNKSTLYSGDGTKQGLVVKIVNGAPTGVVFNGGPGFIVTSDGASGPARFIFASESGTISGWSPAVNGTRSIAAVTTPGAVYKGIALATAASGPQLYATDFANGRVDVFNASFGPGVASGGFVDPNLPAGYAPFGISAVNGMLVVTYGKTQPGSTDEAHGPGLGVVDAFDTDGNLIARIATHGALNAPWGIALAPSSFGKFGGDLLIGNFGDGRINAYAPQSGGTWMRAGVLRGPSKAITIDGLWGIGFGNDAAAGPSNTLYFAAGPDDEAHGLFGSVTAN